MSQEKFVLMSNSWVNMQLLHEDVKTISKKKSLHEASPSTSEFEGLEEELRRLGNSQGE